MPCEPIIRKGKVTGFMCSREKYKPKCYKCSKPATRFCDHRGGYKYHKGYQEKDGFIHRAYETADIETCDKPMCDECTNPAGVDEDGEKLDLCDEHNNELSKAMWAKAEPVYQKIMRKMGLDE